MRWRQLKLEVAKLDRVKIDGLSEAQSLHVHQRNHSQRDRDIWILSARTARHVILDVDIEHEVTVDVARMSSWWHPGQLENFFGLSRH